MIDIKTASAEELMERKSAIAAEIDIPEADLDALEEEARAINKELEDRRAIEAQKNELREKVAGGAGKTQMKMEEKKMKMRDFLNTKEYIDAYARYIKTEKENECRALLTENGYTYGTDDGPLPVPTYIEGRIRTAWENNRLMSLVRKTYLRGNVKIGFELSADGAVIHSEGAAAPEPESLAIGIVNMVPQSIKKWIKISDETVDMGGQEFLDYIFDELSYRIAKKAEDELLKLITTTAGTTASSTAVSVAEITSDGTDLLGIVANAYSQITDEAANPVVVMNKLTYGQFKAAVNGADYLVNPFENFPVFFNNTLSTIGATTGAWLVVGDFGVGAQANFPNGDTIRIKYDDLSLAEADMVKIVGREYIGMGLVTDKAFCRVMCSTT